MTTIVAGVGMIPFAKPGASAPYDAMGEEAVKLALKDAGLGYEAIEQAYAGYVYGDSTAGQKVLYRTFKDGEELESWRWEESWTQEGKGEWDEPLYPEYSESFRFEPGEYSVEIFVDYQLAGYGTFKVEE